VASGPSKGVFGGVDSREKKRYLVSCLLYVQTKRKRTVMNAYISTLLDNQTRPPTGGLVGQAVPKCAFLQTGRIGSWNTVIPAIIPPRFS
jgi:hypothetical protein